MHAAGRKDATHRRNLPAYSLLYGVNQLDTASLGRQLTRCQQFVASPPPAPKNQRSTPSGHLATVTPSPHKPPTGGRDLYIDRTPARRLLIDGRLSPAHTATLRPRRADLAPPLPLS